MEEKTLRCPNCGANATNHNNCEYCGSLLVRFVEKGIDLSKTSYTSNTEVFPGLIKELKQNLALQKQGDESTVTDIYRAVGQELYVLPCVLRTGKADWLDSQNITLSNSKTGLIIALNFSTYVDEKSNADFNQKEENKLALFKQLPCFELFTSHRCFYTDPWGDERKGIEYAIDFGEDAEGAARLISEIMIKVFGVPLDEGIEFYTNYGSDNVNKSRKQVNASRGNEEESDSSQIPWWGWAIGVFILFKLIQWLF